VAVFGDNHKPFIHLESGCCIVNCGGFMRRKVDERCHRPGVVLLYDDATVERYTFSIADETFAEVSEAEAMVDRLLDMDALIKSLKTLGADEALDFRAAVDRFLVDNAVPEPVARIILEACSEGVL